MVTKINFGKLSIIFKDEFDRYANYERLDIVIYKGDAYICKQNCQGILPTNTVYWQLMVKKGKSAYEIYKDNVPAGSTILTESEWLNTLKGQKGDRGEKGYIDTSILNGYATEQYVIQKIQELINGAPAALDTLGEIADKLSDNDDAIAELLNILTEKANITDIPTKVSDLSNDKGYLTNADTSRFITEQQLLDNYYTKNDIDNKHYLIVNNISTKLDTNDVSKFITLNDISTKLELNDISTKLEANDVSKFITLNDVSTKANKGELFSGSYNDLFDKPYIPEKVSDLVNDREYTALSDLSTALADLVNSAPETLDTLGEIANALESADSSILAIINTIGNKANKDDVYTKDAINTSILNYAQPKGNYALMNDISIFITSNDIADKADKSEIPEKVSELENDSHYLVQNDVSHFITDHQSLEDYYNKQEIDASIIEYAQPKGDYLTEHQDLSLLVTKFEVSTGYYNKHEVELMITATGTFTPELYYTKTDINEKLVNDTSKFITLNDTSQYLTEHQSLAEYDNSIGRLNTSVNSIEQKITGIDSSWDKYYNKQEIDTSIISYIESQNFLTEQQDISGKANTEDVDASIDIINSSIMQLKQNIVNIDSSWSKYVTNETFNNIVNADADGTINKFNEIVEFLDGIDDTDNTLYNTLSSINTSVNDISAKLNNIDSSWTNYYTKVETNIHNTSVNNIIDNVNSSIIRIDENIGILNSSMNNADSSIASIKEQLNNTDSSWINYYTKSQIDASIIEYAQPKGEYLVAADIEGKANTEDIPTAVSQLTNDTEYLVQNDVSNFAYTNNVYSKQDIDTSIAAHYYSKGEANNTFMTEHQTQAILGDYVTKTEANAYLTVTDISAKADKSELNAYVTSEQLNNILYADDNGIIDKFNEITDFLANIAEDDDITLAGLLSQLENKIPTDYISTEDSKSYITISDASNNYVTKDNLNTSINDLKIIINNKIDGNDVYTKHASDDKYATKTDISIFAEGNNVYTKDEINSSFVTKNDASIYLVSNDISVKADRSELDNYVTTEAFNNMFSSTDADAVINTYKEIEEFLHGISDASTLTGILENIQTPINASIVTIKGNIQDIDSSWNYYYTKTEIEEKQYLVANDISIKADRTALADVALTGSYTDLIGTPSIPTNVSELTNDSNYLVSTDISTKAEKSEIPTKISDLDNDSGFTTNIGTLTGITMNNETVNADENGVIDLGNIITQHQSLEEYAKIADVDVCIGILNSSMTNTDSSIVSIKKRLDNIDSSWDYYYDKEYINANNNNINVSINNVNSSIIRIDSRIDILNSSVNNADSSIVSIKERIDNIDSSWAHYLTVDTFNNIINADTDNTINKFNEIVDFLAGIDPQDDTLYNTLYSINASINNVSTRLNNIDASWSSYYTKKEINTNNDNINASINNINGSIIRIEDITGVLNSSMNNTDSSITRINSSIGILNNSVNNVAGSITRINSSIGILNNSVNNTDSSIISIKDRLDDIDSSWNSYYTKQQADTSIIAYAQPKGNYAMSDDVSSYINNNDSSIINIVQQINNIFGNTIKINNTSNADTILTYFETQIYVLTHAVNYLSQELENAKDRIATLEA